MGNCNRRPLCSFLVRQCWLVVIIRVQIFSHFLRITECGWYCWNLSTAALSDSSQPLQVEMCQKLCQELCVKILQRFQPFDVSITWQIQRSSSSPLWSWVWQVCLAPQGGFSVRWGRNHNKPNASTFQNPGNNFAKILLRRSIGKWSCRLQGPIILQLLTQKSWGIHQKVHFQQVGCS